KEGIDAERLRSWCEEHGWEKILNRQGTTFRKLDEADKQDLDQDKARALMQANPSMIKRPVLDTGPRRLVGFKPELYATAFGFHAPRTTHLMSDHFSLALGIGALK